MWSPVPYQGRLKRPGLFSLERRKLNRDMVGVYENLKGVDKVNKKLLFTKPCNVGTRGHPVKLEGDRFKTNKRKSFFMQDVVPWISDDSVSTV